MLLKEVLKNEMEAIMRENDKVILVESDLARANNTYDIRKAFPERVVDVGIAEQNMVSTAAGLAAYGFLPVCTSFAPFIARRACDQIAVSVCYANLNVKFLGTDPTICAELNGGTHMGVEDIGVLRSMPRMLIVEPCDAVEMRQCLRAVIAHDGPAFVRVFRKEDYALYGSDYQFDLYKAHVYREGADVSLFAMGAVMMKNAVTAAELLQADGVSAEVVNVHTVKPIDEETLCASARKTGAVVTCENHNVVGGLKAAVAEVLCDNSVYVPFKAVGVQDRIGEVGFLPYLQEAMHMTPADIAAAAKEAIAKK